MNAVEMTWVLTRHLQLPFNHVEKTTLLSKVDSGEMLWQQMMNQWLSWNILFFFDESFKHHWQTRSLNKSERQGRIIVEIFCKSCMECT
jgi:hypothetical protein